jgi:hypothetical protein
MLSAIEGLGLSHGNTAPARSIVKMSEVVIFNSFAFGME